MELRFLVISIVRRKEFISESKDKFISIGSQYFQGRYPINIGELLQGYHILQGSPLFIKDNEHYFDPGFRREIFEKTFTKV